MQVLSFFASLETIIIQLEIVERLFAAGVQWFVTAQVLPPQNFTFVEINYCIDHGFNAAARVCLACNAKMRGISM